MNIIKREAVGLFLYDGLLLYRLPCLKVTDEYYVVVALSTTSCQPRSDQTTKSG